MEKEHTPAVTTPNRTVYRLTQQEAVYALHDWLKKGGHVPRGKMSVFFPTYDSDKSFHIALEVIHDDPPPTQKDAADE